MVSPSGVHVGMQLHDENGESAEVLEVGSGVNPQLRLRLKDGTSLELPAALLRTTKQGPVYTGRYEMGDQTSWTIPVMHEQAEIELHRRELDRGVRIAKHVDERDERFTVPVTSEEWSVERVAIDRLLEPGEVPRQRQEGDVLILPVLEEVAVVEKRLRLKEEIRIVRRQHREDVEKEVRLKRERVEVERFGDASE